LKYLQFSRSPFYSYIFVLPLFFVYESGVFLIISKDIPQLRNGADVLLKNFLEIFGIIGIYGYGFLLLSGFLFVYFIQRRKWKEIQISLPYLFFMFIESLIWAGGLFWIMKLGHQMFLMNPNTKIIIQRVILSIGAGIYEEFIFRLFLIAGFSYLIAFALQWKPVGSKIVAVIASAVVFSLFHFIGVLGDQPNVSLFMIRFLGGVFLGILYCFRGFGITAYAHSMYDLFLLILGIVH